jgi:DNA-binding GntR family transcriptional regulator
MARVESGAVSREAVAAIGQPRASDLAYDQLRERILDLRLPPGSLVNERAVTADLGLGRMPVREAIARLVTDRFITVLPRRGAVVTPIGLDDVLDMFEAREAIECGVVHIVANRMAAEDLATLRRLVAAADRARDGTDHEEFLRDDHAVHQFLVHAVRNTLLQEAADRLLLHNLRFWRTYWESRPAEHATMISHASLLAALEAHDAEQAVQAMREHLAAARQLLYATF